MGAPTALPAMAAAPAAARPPAASRLSAAEAGDEAAFGACLEQASASFGSGAGSARETGPEGEAVDPAAEVASETEGPGDPQVAASPVAPEDACAFDWLLRQLPPTAAPPDVTAPASPPAAGPLPAAPTPRPLQADLPTPGLPEALPAEAVAAGETPPPVASEVAIPDRLPAVLAERPAAETPAPSFSSLMPSLPPTAAATPPVAALPAAPLPMPLPGALDLEQAGWDLALGEHIAWQLDQEVSEARIELHPLDLGALTIRIETRGDRAEVQFLAAEAATRQLLQQSLPQLRQLLGGQGVQLGRSQIEARAPTPQRAGAEAGPRPRRHVGRVVLVDAYA